VEANNLSTSWESWVARVERRGEESAVAEPELGGDNGK
jgi:hypothetical protein